MSLPVLIEAITVELRGKTQLDMFEMRLAEFGYVPFPEYAEATYTVAARKWYAVTDGFPRILPNSIPSGVEDTKYAVRLSACDSFEGKPDWAGLKENLT